jgi:hypothetical protein
MEYREPYQLECNVPKTIYQEHHGLGAFLNYLCVWYFVKHFVDLLVCMCLLAGWPLDFGLRVYVQ